MLFQSGETAVLFSWCASYSWNVSLMHLLQKGNALNICQRSLKALCLPVTERLFYKKKKI